MEQPQVLVRDLTLNGRPLPEGEPVEIQGGQRIAPEPVWQPVDLGCHVAGFRPVLMALIPVGMGRFEVLTIPWDLGEWDRLTLLGEIFASIPMNQSGFYGLNHLPEKVRAYLLSQAVRDFLRSHLDRLREQYEHLLDFRL